jgi:ribosomal protein S18 acetylase RimI-like enzyme
MRPEPSAGDGAVDLTLRPATEEDARVLADLHVAARSAAVPQMPPMVHSAAETLTWIAGLLTDQRHELWVAEEPDGVVGYLALEDGWLDSLYVAPGRTGNGIGRVLLELAKGLRPDGLGLWVFQSNEGAQRFYRRHGFTEAERTDGSENEERAPDIRMTWTP